MGSANHAPSLPDECARVRTPGAVHYKGEHIRTTSGDLLTPANADSVSEWNTRLRLLLFCDEIELRRQSRTLTAVTVLRIPWAANAAVELERVLSLT